MARQQRWAPGEPCWIDLRTSQWEEASAFYAAVFGWTAGEQSEAFGGYAMFFYEGLPVAGCEPNRTGGPDEWVTYFSTADCDAAVARALAHGATVATPALDGGELGRMARVVDGAGALVGLWEPREFGGFGVFDEVGAPQWFELHTRASGEARQFITETLGVEVAVMSDTDDFRYATLQGDRGEVGGLFEATTRLAPDEPNHWKVYIGVPSADEALTRAVEAGGQALTEASSPYGRFATIADPGGAQLVVMQSAGATP